jgi:hypothetical protein
MNGSDVREVTEVYCSTSQGLIQPSVIQICVDAGSAAAVPRHRRRIAYPHLVLCRQRHGRGRSPTRPDGLRRLNVVAGKTAVRGLDQAGNAWMATFVGMTNRPARGPDFNARWYNTARRLR